MKTSKLKKKKQLLTDYKIEYNNSFNSEEYLDQNIISLKGKNDDHKKNIENGPQRDIVPRDVDENLEKKENESLMPDEEEPSDEIRNL